MKGAVKPPGEKKALEDLLIFIHSSCSKKSYIVGIDEESVAVLIQKLKEVSPANSTIKTLESFSHWSKILSRLKIDRDERMLVDDYFKANISANNQELSNLAQVLRKSVIKIVDEKFKIQDLCWIRILFLVFIFQTEVK